MASAGGAWVTRRGSVTSPGAYYPFLVLRFWPSTPHRYRLSRWCCF